MVRTRPTCILERCPQTVAGTVEPDRCVVGRDTQVAGHLVERLAPQFYPANQFGMLGFQGRNNIVHTGADRGEERLVRVGRR